MISAHAIVETDQIGSGVVVHPFAVIRKGAVLGDGVVVHPHAVIESGVILGDRVEAFPGSYLGKEPKGAGATARTPVFDRTVLIGSDCSIGPHAVIYYDVRIGPNTLVGDGASIREKVTIGERCIISRYVTINYNTQIGDRTKIMDLTHITGNCRIGNDVFVGMLVSTANDKAIGRQAYNEERVVGPEIADRAAVGTGSIVLPGVRVGVGSIVGAQALVTRDVPDGMKVLGIPAHIVGGVS